MKCPINSIRAQSNSILEFKSNLPVCLHLELWFSVWRWTDPLQSRPGNLPLRSKRQMLCYKGIFNFQNDKFTDCFKHNVMWVNFKPLQSWLFKGVSKDMQRVHLLHRQSEAYSDLLGKREILELVGLTAQVSKFSIYSQNRRKSMAVFSSLSHWCTSVLEGPDLIK